MKRNRTFGCGHPAALGFRAALPFSIVLSASAAAEEPPQRTAPATNETMVYGARSAGLRPSTDASALVTELTGNEIADELELGASLRRAPSVRWLDLGPGQAKTLAMRGAPGHQVSVFLDGIRLNSAGRPGVDLSLLPLDQLRAVVLQRSASGAHLGAGAIGGALFLETAAPQGHQSADVSYGSWNTVVARASTGGQVGRLNYLAGGGYGQSDGDFRYIDENGVLRRRDNNDSRRAELLAKGSGFVTPSWHMALTSLTSASFRGAPGMVERPSTTARQQDVNELIAARLSHMGWLLDGDRLAIGLAHHYGYFHFNEPAPPPAESTNHNSVLTGTTSWLAPLPGVGELELGAEFNNELFFDRDTGARQRVTFDTYASGNYRVVRYLALVPAVRLMTASDFGAKPVPKMGVIVWPIPARVFSSGESGPYLPLQLRGNVGRNVRYPSFAERFLRIDGFGGNPNLRPEDALFADAGIVWTGSWLTFDAAYFHRWLSNLILLAPVSSFLVRPDNYGNARAQGVELEITAALGAHLLCTGTYTFTETDFGDPRLRLPGFPPHQWGGSLSWQGARWARQARALSATGSWWQGIRVWSGVAAQSRMVIDRFNNISEEGRVLLSMGVGYRISPIWTKLDASNLLNKRDAVDALGFPIPPLQVMASLGVEVQ